MGQETAVPFGPSWQIVHRVPVEQTAVSNSLAFVVHGSVGHVQWGANTERHQIEVALGIVQEGGALVVDSRDTFRIALQDTTIGALNSDGGLCSYPFQFLATVAADGYDHPLFGTIWKAAEQLVVVARIVSNGSAGQEASCYVSDVVAVIFDLSELAAEGVPYYTHRYEPQQPQTLTLSPRVLDYGQTLSSTAGEVYLVFHAWSFRSYTGNGGPLLQIMQSDGTLAASRARDELGIDGVDHSPAVPSQIDNLRQMNCGGFAVVEQGRGGLDLVGFSARDQARSVSGFGTAVKRAQWFAVRLKSSAGIDDFYGVRIDDDLDDPQRIVDLFNYPAPGQFGAPFEVQPANPTTYALFTQARIAKSSGLAGRLTSFRHLVTGTDGSPIVSLPVINTTTKDRDEPVPYNAYIRGRDLAGQAGFRIVWANTIGSIAIPAPLAASWYRTVGFGFETNPSTFNFPAVTPGTFVQIVPDRESLDVGSLVELPRQPSAQLDETQEVPGSTFVGDTGYRWRLPKLVASRRSLSIAFDGLDATERDELLQFFRSNPTFAWTPPGEVARPWLVVERPVSSADSIRYVVTVRVLELVFFDNP
jgi:hypothetical protein